MPDTRPLVPIGIGVLCDFTAEEPIDSGEIEESEHNAEDPPDQADAKGVRTGKRVGYRDALACGTCGGQQNGEETCCGSTEHG